MDYELLQTVFRLGLVTFASVMIIIGLACLVALAKAPYRNK
ncbi:hypothetical protein [Microterricola viridarii]|nr:hypothetical protein [Microterricola viridarii]